MSFVKTNYSDKTPNKSGLTPIRPGKSPGTEMKHKSGLTPVRPGVPQETRLKSGLTPIRPSCGQNQAKSNNCQKPKLRSGLLPIKPNRKPDSTTENNFVSLNAKRKSGLKPMKPVGSFNCTLSGESLEEASTFGPKPAFRFPVSAAGTRSEAVSHIESRRKSGLLPVKPNISGKAGLLDKPKQSLWKPRFSVGNSQLHSSSRSFSHKPFAKNLEATTPALNMIQEDRESPVRKESPNNVSGLASLDETDEMSVVIRHRQGQGSSRIRLSRSNLQDSRLSSSDTTKSRIPKRLDLHFRDDECDTVRSYANVLKDGSSKVNVATEQCEVVTDTLQSHCQITPTDRDTHKLDQTKYEETLRQRKAEILKRMQELSTELRDIDQELNSLQTKTCNSVSDSENVIQQDDFNSDSPFAHVVSPCLTNHMELLTLDKSKRPESIYKVFRQSCSFLKTPQPSAFRRADATRVAQMTPNVNDPSMISRNVQEQLAKLFDD